jgi:hypothetical protein
VKAGDDSEAQRLSDSVVTDWLMGMGGDWRSTGPVVAVLDKAFRDARPASLETEYHTLNNILETMIDTAAIKAGNEERLAIEIANEERWAAERQRDFAEVVARLPQNQVARAEQQSIAKGNSRGMIYLLVNVALVGLLAAIAWMRRRKRLAQESTP